MFNGIKRDSLLGLPVICVKTGKNIGKVVDIAFKPGKKKIEGLVITVHGLLQRKKYIPLGQIRTIGQNAVIIEEAVSDESIYSGFYNHAREQYGGHIVGYQLVSGDGQEIGQISDIILNPNDGTVEGYEVSKGIIEDIVDGRSILPYDISNSVTDDAVIVSIEQTNQMKSYNKGIKSMLSANKG
jgi:uncharacterized protein YrrD